MGGESGVEGGRDRTGEHDRRRGEWASARKRAGTWSEEGGESVLGLVEAQKE